MIKISNLYVIKEKRQELRNNATLPEKFLWKYIKGKQLGYRFRRQHSIGKYIADFYCPELHLNVEVDGRFHGEELMVERDAKRDVYFKSVGLITKRYRAQDILQNVQGVLDDLRVICDACASAPHKDGNPSVFAEDGKPPLKSPLERGTDD